MMRKTVDPMGCVPTFSARRNEPITWSEKRPGTPASQRPKDGSHVCTVHITYGWRGRDVAALLSTSGHEPLRACISSDAVGKCPSCEALFEDVRRRHRSCRRGRACVHRPSRLPRRAPRAIGVAPPPAHQSGWCRRPWLAASSWTYSCVGRGRPRGGCVVTGCIGCRPLAGLLRRADARRGGDARAQHLPRRPRGKEMAPHPPGGCPAPLTSRRFFQR